MMKLLVLVLAFGAVLSSPVFNMALDSEWAIFKQVYDRQYIAEEETLRRIIWEGHVHFIQQHNLEADRGMHTYRVGINEYADMTNEEFVKMMNGYIMRNTTESTFLAPSHMADPPAAVDWRTEGYVTPVKNQKQCGSCWAFSTTGSLEGQTFKKTHKLVSLSEQNIMDCSKKQGTNGCEGGSMIQAFTYIKVNGGVDTEESYPYTGGNGKCHFEKANVGATDTGFTVIKPATETALQSAVATVGPISVSMDASHQSFQLYKSGVYKERKCSSKKLDHGVLAVGYGSTSGHDFWIVKNSWGETWGMKGYFEIARNDKNMCGLATQAIYPMV